MALKKNFTTSPLQLWKAIQAAKTPTPPFDPVKVLAKVKELRARFEAGELLCEEDVRSLLDNFYKMMNSNKDLWENLQCNQIEHHLQELDMEVFNQNSAENVTVQED